MTPASVPEPFVSLVLVEYLYILKESKRTGVFIRDVLFLPTLSSVIQWLGLSLG
ncbi:hypothetical protein [Leptospira weilii]|uniref:hypothetical protein n=1 Tax=Leptospira weilii TaxID=28184 RepID=UPI0018AD1631|nr:hypothetical protein [Leptospira weilii]